MRKKRRPHVGIRVSWREIAVLAFLVGVGVFVTYTGYIVSESSGTPELKHPGYLLLVAGTIMISGGLSWVFGKSESDRALTRQIDNLTGSLELSASEIYRAIVDYTDKNHGHEVCIANIDVCANHLTRSIRDLGTLTSREVSGEMEDLINLKKQMGGLGRNMGGILTTDEQAALNATMGKYALDIDVKYGHSSGDRPAITWCEVRHG